MNIIISGHECRNAVEQILQLFFELSADGEVTSSLTTQDGAATVETVISVYGKKASGQACCKADSDRRTISDTVKKSAFCAARSISDMPTPWGISTGIRPAKTAREMLFDGKSDNDIIEFMKNELWITQSKARLSVDVAKREKKLLESRLENGISLYVGIPFCPTRCAYCSFISQAVKHNAKFAEPYTKALVKEIECTARIAEKLGLKAETIYFGGGTPTAIPAENLRTLIKSVKNSFDISGLREFTVEAGRPDTIDTEMLDKLASENIGRISINPQTMNDSTLALIGRRHSVEQTVKAFSEARKYGCFSINMDVIAGLPEETTEDFEHTMKEVLSLGPDAVTVHTMYMKRAARLINEFEKYRFTADVCEMVKYSEETLRQNGYYPYYMYKQKNTLGNLENVGYSKNGAECLYNIFIMEEIHTVLAMGGGASTKMVMGDRIERIFNPKEAGDYINRIDEIMEKKNIVLRELGQYGKYNGRQ